MNTPKSIATILTVAALSAPGVTWAQAPTNPGTTAPAQATEEQTMGDLVSAGRANIGFNGVFNFTRAQNELELGGDAINSTFFLIGTPKFGYFLSDGVELAIYAGLLSRRLQRETNTSTENNFLVDVGVNYNAAVNRNLALIVGAGLGGYFGGSSRLTESVDPDTMEPIEVNESTDTFGLDLFAQAGLRYRVRNKLTANAGLNAHFLYGTERAQSSDAGLTVSTLNVGLNLGLAYTF